MIQDTQEEYTVTGTRRSFTKYAGIRSNNNFVIFLTGPDLAHLLPDEVDTVEAGVGAGGNKTGWVLS